MQPTETGVFGLRMLNNVKIQYAQAQNWFEVLDILECQLVVETVDQSARAALQFERGECLLQMEQQPRAQQAFMTCLAMSPSASPIASSATAEQRLQHCKQHFAENSALRDNSYPGSSVSSYPRRDWLASGRPG